MYCTTFIAFWHMYAITIIDLYGDLRVSGKYVTSQTSNSIASISEGRNLVIRRLLSYLLFSVIFSPTLYRIEGKVKIQHHLEYDRWFPPTIRSSNKFPSWWKGGSANTKIDDQPPTASWLNNLEDHFIIPSFANIFAKVFFVLCACLITTKYTIALLFYTVWILRYTLFNKKNLWISFGAFGC